MNRPRGVASRSVVILPWGIRGARVTVTRTVMAAGDSYDDPGVSLTRGEEYALPHPTILGRHRAPTAPCLACGGTVENLGHVGRPAWAHRGPGLDAQHAAQVSS